MVHLLHVVSVQQLHQQGVVVFLRVFRSREKIQSCLATVQRSVRTDEAWLSLGQVLYYFNKHTRSENRVLNKTYTLINRHFLEVQASTPPAEAFSACSPLPGVSFSFLPSPRTPPRPTFLLFAKRKLQEVVEVRHLNPSHRRKELASEVMMVLRIQVVGLEVVYSIRSLRAERAQLCERQQGRVVKRVCNRRLRQNPRLKQWLGGGVLEFVGLWKTFGGGDVA